MEEGLHHGDHFARAPQVCISLNRIQIKLLKVVLQVYGVTPAQEASPTPRRHYLLRGDIHFSEI